MILRHAGMLAAGLALTTSVGLGGAGLASAASPALNIKPNSQWTLEVNGGGCEVDTFAADGTFSTTENGGDAGKWSGGASTVAMKWTAGEDIGITFRGTYVTSLKEYSGSLGGVGNGNSGELVKGAVSGC